METSPVHHHEGGVQAIERSGIFVREAERAVLDCCHRHGRGWGRKKKNVIRESLGGVEGKIWQPFFHTGFSPVQRRDRNSHNVLAKTFTSKTECANPIPGISTGGYIPQERSHVY